MNRVVTSITITNIVIDVTTGNVLDYAGKKRLSHAEISSGRQSYRLAIRISGGVNSKIETQFIFFVMNFQIIPSVDVQMTFQE